MEKYYITSTKYSLRERTVKSGKTVYDVIFRVYDAAFRPHQKVLSGYTSKTLASQGHAHFIATECTFTKKPKIEPQKSALIFSDAYQKYLTYATSAVKESSVYTLMTHFKLYILPKFGDREIEKITSADLYEWQDAMIATKKKDGAPLSIKYIKTVRGQFCAFMNWLSERYGIDNPFKRVKLPKQTKALKGGEAADKLKHWTVEEFDRFIAVVEDPTYHAFFTLLFWCGCRSGEAFALAPKDYKKGALHIYKTYTKKTLDGSKWKITAAKTGKDFTIPLTDRLIKELDAYITDEVRSGEFLFGGSRPLPPSSVTRAFYHYIELSGVPKITLHALRHSFVSMCIHHGANYMVVADLIGDKPEQILKTYGHLWEQDKAKIVSLLS